ncbi:unnamed protein product [Linum trigynum]|uniref:Uncharacterized protein n=1 Tax=Linum trigynum TaxID=586398 RepID=A0AAV2FNF2_9ROSI
MIVSLLLIRHIDDKFKKKKNSIIVSTDIPEKLINNQEIQSPAVTMSTAEKKLITLMSSDDESFAVERMSAPFRQCEEQGAGCFVASREDLVAWLEPRASPAAVTA